MQTWGRFSCGVSFSRLNNLKNYITYVGIQQSEILQRIKQRSNETQQSQWYQWISVAYWTNQQQKYLEISLNNKRDTKKSGNT